MLMLLLVACNENTTSDVENAEEIIQETINSKTAEVPTNEELKSLVETFVNAIYENAEQLGATYDTGLSEDQLDTLVESLSEYAVESLLYEDMRTILLNICLGCDSNAFPVFYMMDEEELTYEVVEHEGNNYTVAASYHNLMNSTAMTETIYLRFEDERWKLLKYEFDEEALPYEELIPSSEVDEELETTQTSIEDENTNTDIPDPFIGYWHTMYDTKKYAADLSISPGYEVELSMYTAEYTHKTLWKGTLTFESDEVATMEFEEDGRAGILTLKLSEIGINLKFDIEEVAENAPYTPWTGTGEVELLLNFHLTESHYWQ